MKVNGALGMGDEAARFARGLSPCRDCATVVALSGDLGAGKTAFVKGVARALGVAEHVTSPTFVIMKIYPIRDAPRSNGAGPKREPQAASNGASPPGGSFKRLVHIDAYRLKGEHHLKVLGWEELLADPNNLIFVEWPEMAGNAIPASAERLTFRYSDDDGREIIYEKEQEAVGAA